MTIITREVFILAKDSLRRINQLLDQGQDLIDQGSLVSQESLDEYLTVSRYLIRDLDQVSMESDQTHTLETCLVALESLASRVVALISRDKEDSTSKLLQWVESDLPKISKDDLKSTDKIELSKTVGGYFYRGSAPVKDVLTEFEKDYKVYKGLFDKHRSLLDKHSAHLKRVEQTLAKYSRGDDKVEEFTKDLTKLVDGQPTSLIDEYRELGQLMLGYERHPLYSEGHKSFDIRDVEPKKREITLDGLDFAQFEKLRKLTLALNELSTVLTVDYSEQLGEGIDADNPPLSVYSEHKEVDDVLMKANWVEDDFGRKTARFCTALTVRVDGLTQALAHYLKKNVK